MFNSSATDQRKMIWPSILICFLIYFVWAVFAPLQYDDLLTIRLMDAFNFQLVKDWLVTNDAQRPLYFKFLWIYSKIFATGALSYRLPSLIFFFWAVTKLTRESKSFSWLIPALCLFSTAPQHFALLVRPYPLLFLFAVYQTLTARKLIFNSTPKLWIKYAMVSFFAYQTHYFGMVLTLSQLIVLLIIGMSAGRQNLKWGSLSMLGLGLIFIIPFFGELLNDFNTRSFFRQDFSLVKFFDVVTYIFSGGFPFILTLFLIKKDLTEKHFCYENGLFLGTVFIPFFIVLAKSLISAPVLEGHYLVIVIPSLWLYIDNVNKKSNVAHKIFLIVYLLLLTVKSFLLSPLPWQRSDFDSIKIAQTIKQKLIEKPESIALTCHMCLKIYIDDKNYFCDDEAELLNVLKKADLAYLLEFPWNTKVCRAQNFMLQNATELEKMNLDKGQLRLYKIRPFSRDN